MRLTSRRLAIACTTAAAATSARGVRVASRSPGRSGTTVTKPARPSASVRRTTCGSNRPAAVAPLKKMTAGWRPPPGGRATVVGTPATRVFWITGAAVRSSATRVSTGVCRLTESTTSARHWATIWSRWLTASAPSSRSTTAATGHRRRTRRRVLGTAAGSTLPAYRWTGSCTWFPSAPNQGISRAHRPLPWYGGVPTATRSACRAAWPTSLPTADRRYPSKGTRGPPWPGRPSSMVRP